MRKEIKKVRPDRSDFLIDALIVVALVIPLGSVIGYRIVIVIENNAVYDRRIYLLGWLYATIITQAFTVIIINLSLRKVKDLKLPNI